MMADAVLPVLIHRADDEPTTVHAAKMLHPREQRCDVGNR